MSTAPANPFRALESYTREDRERFFGRDSDLTLILDRILSGRTTLLFAASGVGKTSFLNARVIPDLEDRFFVAYHNRWTGGVPLTLVADSILEHWNASQWRTGPPIRGAPNEPAGLVALYASLQGNPDHAARCSGSLLVLDQFEELFQQHGNTQPFSDLIGQLADVINTRVPDVRVLFSMREEFLGDLSVFDNRVPDLFNNYYRLKQPDRRLARTIIAKTARTSGVEPDPALETLVADLAAGGHGLAAASGNLAVLHDSVPPPFLQIACRGLWESQFGAVGEAAPAPERARPAARFPAGYRAGQANQHLEGYAQRILSKLSNNEQFWLSEALGFLITRRGAKLAYEAAALAEHSGAPEPLVRALFDKLSAKDAKLFRRTVAADGSVWYELYHDMYSPFFSQWKARFQKEWRTRRTRRIGAAAAALIAVAAAATVLTVMYQVSSRSETLRADFRASLINRPIEEYQLRFGQHAGRVMDVAFSPDGAQIATASFDNTAKVWDATRRLAIDTIPATGGLHAVAFHPNPRRRLLALGGANARVDLYSLESKRTERSWAFGTTVYSIAFSPDGNTIACGGDGGQLWLFHLDGRPQQRLTLPAAVNALAFSPDGQKLVIGDFNGGVQAMSLGASPDSGAAGQTLKPHAISVLGVAVSPNGEWTASSSRDQLIHLFDRSGKLVRSLTGHTSSVRSVAFSPDNRLLASASVDGTVRLWDLSTGRQVGTLLGHVGAVYAAAFSPSGALLASSGQDRTVRLWDVATRKEAGQLEGAWAVPQRAQFSPDLSRIITERSSQGTHLWTGPELEQTFDQDVTALAMTPETRQLLVGRKDGTITISALAPHGAAEAATTPPAPDASLPGWPAGTTSVVTGLVHGILLSGNGEAMAVVSEKGKDVRLYSGRSMASADATTYSLGADPAWFVVVNATGNGLTLANQRRFAMFARGSSTPIVTRNSPAGRSILGVAYDVFQRLVVFYDNYSVDLVNGDGRADRSLLFEPRPRDAAVAAVATEDGHVFAFVDASGQVNIWSAPEAGASTSTSRIELRLPQPAIALAFARGGKRLATIDRNGTVRTFAPFDRDERPKAHAAAQASSRE